MLPLFKYICMTSCNGISWDSQDLIACKQAFLIMIQDGWSLEDLKQLDFGNLDCDAVYDEIDEAAAHEDLRLECELNAFEAQSC